MKINPGWLWLCAALAACGDIPDAAEAAAGAEGAEGAEDEATETTSAALLNNVAYTPGQPFVGKQIAPAAAVFQGKAFLGFVRNDGKIGIIIDSNLGNGTGQSVTSFALTDMTAYGPCLVVYQNKLHLIYVDSGRLLKVRRSADGVNWESPMLLDGNPLFAYQPTAVDFNGVLHVYAVILNGANSILEVRWNGVNELGNSFTDESSNRGPYAAVWNGQIFLAWAGRASNNPISIKHGTGNHSWSSPTLVSGNFGYPALIPITSQRLAMVYRGNNARIFRVDTTDGVSFGQYVMDTVSATNFTPIPFMRVSLSQPTVWTFYTGQNGQFYTVRE